MPEHRQGTPVELLDLESFLWHDLDTPKAWRGWMEQRRFDGYLADTSFANACEVQGALRFLEAANNGIAVPTDVPGALDRLNRAIETHALTATITVDSVSVDARPGDPVGHILSLAIDALATGSWRRFKLCRDAACRASFYDTSKNGSKKWCSMELCGSRNKMRRSRAKA